MPFDFPGNLGQAVREGSNFTVTAAKRVRTFAEAIGI
jgi:hypothetical protein